MRVEVMGFRNWIRYINYNRGLQLLEDPYWPSQPLKPRLLLQSTTILINLIFLRKVAPHSPIIIQFVEKQPQSYFQ